MSLQRIFAGNHIIVPKIGTLNIHSKIKIPKMKSGPREENLMYSALELGGKKWSKIFDPSSGGIGIRLKKASAKFICMKRKRRRKKRLSEKRKSSTPFPKKFLIKNADKMPTAKFEAGPADATIAISLNGFLKLKGFTGTGLAHPNLAINSIIVPMGSRWLNGFIVSLPEMRGVESPNL